MSSRPHRRIASGCYYCGRPLPSGDVCASCRELYDADPLGKQARQPVDEGELLRGVRRQPDVPDQWREARS